jgi:putative ABC transport system permease protein
LASIALGAVVGLPINMYLSRHGITLSEPFSFGGVQYATANSEVNLPSFIIPAVLVFLAAFLVSIFPAVKAARTDPAKSLRIY